jgi:hypothetical protein
MIATGIGSTIVGMRVNRANFVVGFALALGAAGACSNSSNIGRDAADQGGAPGTGGEWAAGGGSAGGAGSGGAISSASGGRASGGAGSGGAIGNASGGRASGGASQGGAAAGLLDPARTTAWNPGILTDDQLHLPLGGDGLPVRTTVCASPKPGDDLNAAIKACPEGQVVNLAAGTYTIASVVTLNKGVVLRGAGSQGAAKGGTTIVKTGGQTVLAIGLALDQACYNRNRPCHPGTECEQVRRGRFGAH